SPSQQGAVARRPDGHDPQTRGRPLRPLDRRPGRAPAAQDRARPVQARDDQVGARSGLHLRPARVPRSTRMSATDFPSLYERIFHTAADALIVIDADGRIRVANRQAERLFGYEGDALLALAVEDLLPHRFRENHRRYRGHYERKPESRP